LADLFAGILGLVHRLLKGVPQLLRLLTGVLPLVLHVVQLLPRVLQIPAGQREKRPPFISNLFAAVLGIRIRIRILPFSHKDAERTEIMLAK
jgi:hypothetical protein